MYESNVRYFSINTFPPEISINSPTNSQIFGSNAPVYDLSIIGLYEAIWYTLDGGVTYIPASGLTGTIDQTEWDKLTYGIVTITFYANNSGGFVGSASVQVIKQITSQLPPGIPGYDIIALIGVCCIVIVIIINKRGKTKA
jgi:hypothetical protein